MFPFYWLTFLFVFLLNMFLHALPFLTYRITCLFFRDYCFSCLIFFVTAASLVFFPLYCMGVSACFLTSIFAFYLYLSPLIYPSLHVDLRIFLFFFYLVINSLVLFLPNGLYECVPFYLSLNLVPLVYMCVFTYFFNLSANQLSCFFLHGY